MLNLKNPRQDQFDEWCKLKSNLDTKLQPNRYIKEKEIWWCAIGQNIGSEMYGKSQFYSRPVLVIKKLSRGLFSGAPLTTKNKQGNWFVPITFKEINQVVVIAQLRLYDTKRLYRKIGELDDKDFLKVLDAGKDLIFKYSPEKSGAKGKTLI